LDFFFGKQKQTDTPRDAHRKIGQDGVEKVTEANGVGEQPMTDEEYARKLQEEYDQQERKRNGSPVEHRNTTTETAEKLKNKYEADALDKLSENHQSPLPDTEDKPAESEAARRSRCNRPAQPKILLRPLSPLMKAHSLSTRRSTSQTYQKHGHVRRRICHYRSFI